MSSTYGLPRAALVKMLDRPGALEREIAIWIADRARARARDLFADDTAGAPDGNDLWSRAVAGCYRQLVAARDAAIEAERRQRWAATDAYLRRVKAGEVQVGDDT